jgi:HPt (histidine-containing phosphotransfer) domain-containing protein
MNGFLSKPVSAEALEQVILRTLRFSLSADGADSNSLTSAQQDELASIRAQLQELAAMLDPEATVAIVKLCKEDWPKQLERAQSALSTQDAATVRRVAHYLAGSTLQIGAKMLGKRCKELEALAQRAHIPQDLNALTTLFQQVSTDIFAILSAL